MSYLDHYRPKPQPDPQPVPQPRTIVRDGVAIHLTGAQVRQLEQEQQRAAAEMLARGDARRQQEAQEAATKAKRTRRRSPARLTPSYAAKPAPASQAVTASLTPPGRRSSPKCSRRKPWPSLTSASRKRSSGCAPSSSRWRPR